MRIVQTEVSESEHRLLEEYAQRNSITIREALRQAIRKLVETGVDPKDPIFIGPPSSKRTGEADDESARHDAYAYGGTS